MRDGQRASLKQHPFTDFELPDKNRYLTAADPKPLNKDELAEARDELVLAWKRFIIRCHHENLASFDEAKAACQAVGVWLERKDIENDFPPP